MTEKVLIAGSGGQGIELSGELLAEAVMCQGRQVTFFPSYGAQVRGGHAYCHVVFSTEPIRSPVVERPDTLIALTQSAYDKYHESVDRAGTTIANTSLVRPSAGAANRVVPIPATDEAVAMGNVLVANMIIMGAYHAVGDSFDPNAFLSAMERRMTGAKAALVEINRRAFAKGGELARSSL